MKSRLNADTLKNHFTYNWWKYLMVLIIGVFGVDLLYTLTEPRVPDDKKIEMIVIGASLDQDFNIYMENVRADRMPEMQQMELTVIPDDDTAIQYLVTRIGAHQGGELYLLPKSLYESMISNGVLLPLEDDLELINIIAELNYPDNVINELTESLRTSGPDDLDPQKKQIYNKLVSALQDLNLVWNTDYNSREKHVFGIPVSYLSGLDPYFYTNTAYLCLNRYSRNPDNAKSFFHIVCRDMLTDSSVISGPVIHQVGITVLGESSDSSFSGRMDQLMALQTDGSIRLNLFVQSDLNAVLKDFYDRDCDIYLIPREYFTPLAGEGSFLALENDEVMQSLDPAELVGYWTVNNSTGAASLYGIPVSQITHLAKYFHVEDGILCVRASEENAAYALKVFRLLVRGLE